MNKIITHKIGLAAYLAESGHSVRCVVGNDLRGQWEYNDTPAIREAIARYESKEFQKHDAAVAKQKDKLKYLIIKKRKELAAKALEEGYSR